MAINPNGFVPVLDFGNARIITAICRATVSGGQLVSISGASPAVNSGLPSFVAADIQIDAVGSALNCGGLAIANQTSGLYVGVMTRGMVILTAGGTVTGGFKAEALTSIGVQDSTTAGNLIGRFYSTAASGNFALIDLNV